MVVRTQEGTSSPRLYYGWVIVGSCCILLVMLAGVNYTYGIFFKPLIADFHWSRAAVSGVYSVYMLVQGFSAIGMGFLADRFGPGKVILSCAFVAGVGLLLTSQIKELWQMYVTFSLITSVGLAGSFAISSAIAVRWFTRNRGLALGIVSSGVGLGTLVMSPVVERLIGSFGWSKAYIILGSGVWVVMVICALLLKVPKAGQFESYNNPRAHINEKYLRSAKAGMSLSSALGSRFLWILFAAFSMFNFCVQMVMVHLVNYATDMGIATLIAATFVSIIGLGSVGGRLGMGIAADRIGVHNALIISCLVLFLTMGWLIFVRQVWTFYIFAVIFGFAYGGEVPQMPALVDKFFGLRSVAALVGFVQSGSHIGGALGSWAAGKIFDLSNSYALALLLASSIGCAAVIVSVLLKRQARLAAPDANSG